MKDANYVLWRNLDNTTGNELTGAPGTKTCKDLKKDLIRLAAHADKQFTPSEDGFAQSPIESLKAATEGWDGSQAIEGEKAKTLRDWLETVFLFIDEDNEKEETRFDGLKADIEIGDARNAAVQALRARVPVFVLFSNYFRVRPLIHLKQLATRITNGTLDEERYDYGNVCLLNLLGFDAEELSEMGASDEPDANDPEALEAFREKLDERQYQLNAAEVNLTREVRSVWKPDQSKGEAAKLRLRADGQYLKVTVEDDLGVEVELNQRSEGFR